MSRTIAFGRVHDGEIILIAGALLAGGLLAGLLATGLRVPGLVLVLGLGMLIGSDGTGWIDFNDYRLARSVGIVALALILFEGGLAAGFSEIRPVLAPALALAVLGTIATAVVSGLAAHWLFDMDMPHGMLVGSMLAATDGAAVFAVLRGSTLRRRLARTLEGEAGMNDPVAVLLVLGFIDWIQKPGYGVPDMLGLFARQLAIGAGVGAAAAGVAALMLPRLRLASAGLYPVASLALAALAFGTADVLGGSGFLAVYLAGLALGSIPSPATRTMAAFHEGLAWLAQVTMFLVLGLLVFPSRLDDVLLRGTIIAIVATVLARPLATVLVGAAFRFSLAERLVLGWAGLRGAVPVVLATFPVLAGVDGAVVLLDIAFFAVLVSTIVQGATFQPLAERLGVTSSEAALPAPLIEPALIRRLGAEVVEYRVGKEDAAAGRRVRELGLPREALLNVIVRNDQAIPPRGSTTIEPGDRLHVLVRQEVAVEFRDLLARWRDGPLEPVRRRRAVPRGATVFTTRPWTDADGDPARPQAVSGIDVVEQLRTRRDTPGALVALADGRFAVTGSSVAIGSTRSITDVARRRVQVAATEDERAWWREVVGALASY
jgi:cell volume regulation protein A